MKQDRPFWFNVLFFSINLLLVVIPFYCGIMIFNHSPLLFGLLVGMGYLFIAGTKMTQVIKAIIKDESI